MRSQTQSRFQDHDDDSDIDDIGDVQPAIRQSSTRRPLKLKPSLASSDDDSHDENVSAAKSGNLLNAHKNSLDLPPGNAPSKQPARAMNMRRVVSKPSSNEDGSGKGFVPRDISSKLKRSGNSASTTAVGQPSKEKVPSSENSKYDDEDESSSMAWITAPKKFLSEPTVTAADSNRSGVTRIPTTTASRRPPPQPSSPRSARYEPSKANSKKGAWENHVEGMDSDEEGSAHTEESGDTQGAESDGPEEFGIPAQSSSSYQHSKSETYNESDMDPTLIQDGEFYSDFRAKSLALNAPVSKPNKSGRYIDNTAEDSPKTPSGSFFGSSARPPNVKSSWTSVHAPAQGPSYADFGPSSRYSFVMVAHAKGVRTEHVQCTVVRDRRASINGKLHPTYELILEETNKAIILAQKMNMNRTSNYHLFDLTRAQLSTKFSKKSGNYLGKLRAKNINRTEYVLLNQNSEREEIAGVRFDRVSLMNQIKEGNQPRKMKVMIPPNNEYGVPVPNKTMETDAGSLAEKLAEYETTAVGHGSKDLFVFESKDPVLENGNFRLNFHGRVSKPSVKNFQMVSREDTDNVICQFGKVDEDVFHLDFKAPLNAYQAFAFALCQFNL
mmetsp:Transcript_83142/g.162954  ORF Transcript_83142/g.162954 Transcript_83142/m.162954 type:complete len:610 (+) Transcript_83142:101-1930(+)